MKLKKIPVPAATEARREARETVASLLGEAGAKPFKGRLVYGAKSIKALRHNLGLTQKGLAKMLMVVPGAVESWEQGRRVPDTGRMAMIHLLIRHPATFRPLLEETVRELAPEATKALATAAQGNR